MVKAPPIKCVNSNLNKLRNETNLSRFWLARKGLF